MSSQLGNQNIRGSKRDNCYACYSDLVDDVFRGLLPWLRYVRAAVAQARREPFDVLALSIQTAGHNVRPCPPGILDRWLDENDRMPVCVCEGDGDDKKSRSDLRSYKRRWMLFQEVSQQNPGHRARNGQDRAMFGDRFPSKLLGIMRPLLPGIDVLTGPWIANELGQHD